MKRRLRKFLEEWIIPPGFMFIMDRIYSGQSLRTTAHESAILARNVRFRDMYVGRRCFVIGNGPSLNKQDLTPLANEMTIVMNHFHRHPILEQWQPTFYCEADPPINYTTEQIELRKSLLSKLDPQGFFLRMEMKTMVENHNMFPLEKTYYVKMVHKSLTERTVPDLTKPMPGARDTSILALMLALTLGCSPIYCLGLDYDWLSHRSQHRHFYDVCYPVEERADRDDLGSYSYLHLIEMSRTAWRSHQALLEIAQRRGQKILNATEGGFLDVYPTVPFADAMGDSRLGPDGSSAD